MRQKRYDKITLDRTRAIKLDNGMLRVPARISRVGTQEYRKSDGSLEIAYRPPEEVGAEKSLATFDGVPLVNDHPYSDGGVVTAANAKRLGVGFVMHPRFSNGFVEADLLIEDAEAIADVESGKVEMSAGYFIDRDESPGVSPEGQKYDFVQRNIVGNHVAMVDHGRAGSEVRIQLDAAISTDFAIKADAIRVAPHPERSDQKMIELIIDGVKVEVSQLAATLIAKERDAAKAEVDKVKAELVTKTALCDGLNESVAKLEAAVKEAPEKARAEFKALAELTAIAKTVAPDAIVDGLDAAGIKRAVVAKLSTIKLDDKGADYVSALFDHYVAEHSKKNLATEAAEQELKSKPVSDTKTLSAAEAKAKMYADFFKGN